MLLAPLRADLHLHTVVSPCAEVEMIPPLIIKRAQSLQLRMIAVTDHNTADNVEAVIKAARGTDITVIPGMEVQTREEAHLICLFGALEQVRAWQEIVYANLPDQENSAEVFGAQFVVDETGDFLRMNERLLLTSTRLSVTQVVKGVKALGGLAIAAHIDRPSYSLLANLGFIPLDLGLDAIEVTWRTSPEEMRTRYPYLAQWPMIISGDAHRLSEIRASTQLLCVGPFWEELQKALQGRGGRTIRVIA